MCRLPRCPESVDQRLKWYRRTATEKTAADGEEVKGREGRALYIHGEALVLSVHGPPRDRVAAKWRVNSGQLLRPCNQRELVHVGK